MADSRRYGAPVEDSAPAAPVAPRRRDSDWGAYARTHVEDLSWAAKRAAVSMAAATIRARDGSTGAHSDDVVHLCDAIAEQLGVHGLDRAELLAAAQLHDIGKVAIPQEVLDKPGPLDEREWALIRDHTVAGERIIASVPELREVGRLVRHSHERWDGVGYPDRLAGERIPLASRIVFCADAYHAIRSDRPYRRGRTARATLQEIRLNAGSQFDPVVADALARSAEHMHRTVRRGAAGLAATIRSRRLAALLLTLAVGASALAAGGSQVLRADDDPGPDGGATGTAAPASAGDARPAGGAGAGKRQPAGGDRGTHGKPGADAGKPTLTRPLSARPRSARTRSPAGREGEERARLGTRLVAPPPVAPPRRRVGRPVSPGRSEQAPRRPAQPGKPLGGAPGRSEEAPGRRAPVGPPARLIKPPKAPQAGAPGSSNKP